MIDGERACPPEDIGGTFEFSDFLDYLGGSRKKELVDRFAGIVPYDPEQYDKEIVNRILKVRYDEQRGK